MGKVGHLKKELGLLDLFAIASGAMISSGLFILPGLAYAKSGSAVILSYVIASLLVIPALFSKAELATAMPKAGGDYFYIDRSMGPMMGTIGGFAAWFSLAFKSAFALVGIGIFATILNPGFTEMQMKLVAVFFCVVFTFVNIHGVKHAGKLQIVLVLGLISLLVFYIVVGFFFINPTHFNNFASNDFSTIFSTAGLIFISFGGLTKIGSVAEECKKPGRNIPLGMFLSWGLISLLYLLVISVTIGVAGPAPLRGSLTPISLGASTFLGETGSIIMAIAGILAFVSTANAGILAASRNPMAMGKDKLLPSSFANISGRGTPTFSILFTSAFMILVILFLDLESLVKTASTLKILLFLFVIFSLVIMRESKIRNYRPKFRSPLYPWVQVVGAIGLAFLLFEMGSVPLLLVGCFVLLGFLWYWFFARDKIWREYTLLHLIERITGTKTTGYLVDEELREILIERDDINEQRFEKLIRKCEIVDLYKYLPLDELTHLISHKLAGRLDIDEERIYKILKKRGTNSSMFVHPGIAIVSHIIKERDKFEIFLIRSKKGFIISDDVDPIHAFFVIVASSDQQSFYFHSLMWIVQIAIETDFDKKWVIAKDTEELKNIILESWERRKLV